jgi:hypothetical protein
VTRDTVPHVLAHRTWRDRPPLAYQERASHPRAQLTLEERLWWQRRSGRRQVKQLANATPQERARHYWGVMREAVLAMHQNTSAGEVSVRSSALGGSQASSAEVASTRESRSEANDPSRDTSAPSPGRIPVVAFRDASVTPMLSSGRVPLIEAQGDVADVTGEYTDEYTVRVASAQSIDAKISKLVTAGSVITEEVLDGVDLAAESFTLRS